VARWVGCGRSVAASSSCFPIYLAFGRKPSPAAAVLCGGDQRWSPLPRHSVVLGSCPPWIFGEFGRIHEPIMNPVPTNRVLFWVCYLGGTLGPILGTFLISRSRRPLDDRAFLLSWVLWLFGAVVLIACVWSVRTILLGGAAKSQRPVWLYRAFGWLAIVELLLWVYTVVRAI